MARAHLVKPSRTVADSKHTETLHDLQEKLRRYELIFRATNDVLYDLNLEDATVDWNDALYTQYGYDRTELVGTLEWWVGHIHPDDALLLENRVTELFESGTNSWQHDYRFRRHDGGYNYVHDRGLVLRDRGGKPCRIIGSLLDVTAQRQLDLAKDEFIALVSHQLRTPLTTIRIYGEMLTSGQFGSLSKEQAQWVRNMTDSSARLIDVVGAILNISRIDLGRIKISSTLQDVNELTRNCVTSIMPMAQEKHVSVDLILQEVSPRISLDETVYAQTLHNLLTNAVRYTLPEEGRVVVELKREADGYVLSVRDNGIGVPKDAQEHVFERFYRAKNALGVETQGSGLGLYLVKVMTDAYGGKIWFESSEGKGTTFYLLIPEQGMTST